MKKLSFWMLAAALVMPAISQADDMGMRKGSYGMAGCGLGSMVFAANSKTSQVFAATTNGTFGTQTFGISSGTSNCTKGGMAKVEKEKQLFVSMNFETLNKEMAQGTGETLAAFANLYGCDAASFSKASQANYETSLSKASTPEELIDRVNTVVIADATCSG